MTQHKTMTPSQLAAWAERAGPDEQRAVLDATPNNGDVSVYPSPPSAIDVLAGAVDCDRDTAIEGLRALLRAGFVIAPRTPTDGMLAAYIEAYGDTPRRVFSVIQGIAKANARWKAMADAGAKVVMSLSRSAIARTMED